MYFLLEKVDFHCYVSLPEGKLQAFCMIITVLELQCIFEYTCLIFPLASSFLFIESTAVGLGSFGRFQISGVFMMEPSNIIKLSPEVQYR